MTILGAAGTIAAAAPADAAYYYWPDSGSAYYSQQPFVDQPRRQPRARRGSVKKEIIKNTAVHPQMPLIINVSIARQRVRVYDANGFFAESPVSSGMAGHPTPMGVFSVIQKDRYHHSNIYSNAPMPYMQRITWGGVALHAGVVPGYPASHGCIRMPESFAVRMWGWTKLGARVIVSPGELSPSSFEHALLPTMKVAPQPQVSEPANEPVGLKADKGAPDIKPIAANLELRSTVSHDDGPAQHDKTRTADASGDGQKARTTLSDAPSSGSEPAREAMAKADEATADDAKAESASAAAPVDKDPAGAGEVAKNDARTDAAAAANPVDAAASETRSEAGSEQAETTPAAGIATPLETGSASANAGQKSGESSAETAKPETPKFEPVKSQTPGMGTAKSDAPAPAVDPKKDQTRLSGSDKPPKPDGRRKEGQLAVFISRKDSKLYVRQNFAPAWEIPVAIAPGDRPLGTHIFTATVDRNDSNVLHWSVVDVPISARAAMRLSDEPRPRRHKGKAAPVEAKPVPLPDSPAEALDRITIPPEAMARISEALTTGASIIVSDQGINQGETGEYTDFIIRTY